MIRDGHWLFKNRSHLPLVFILMAIVFMWVKSGLYSTDYLWYDLICVLISFSGEVIRIISVGYSPDRTSGRNTSKQVASELNTTGIYSILRNPLYLGNFLMWAGVALFTYIYWLLPIFALLYWLYYERIILAEEDFLASKFGDSYLQYAAEVACFFPSKFTYKPNKYCFRIKKVLLKENASIYGLVFIFVILELYKHFLVTGKLHLDTGWIILGSVSTVIYLILRLIKKTSRWLQTDPQKIKNPC
jgi:protein-S-isoprenylcysteine O-methyltransferase Ste14